MSVRLVGWSAVAATCLLLLNSCTVSGDRQRNATVVVIDLTRSVEGPALQSAVELVDKAVQKIERGDRVAVIPINADAGAQSQGAVLRYMAAEKREPYDGDLHRLHSQARKDIEALAATATHPRSDIIGAVGLAAEELSTAGGFRKTLVVLTDFIQDDRQFNFRADKRVAESKSAHALAGQKAAAGALSGTNVYLGFLRSRDATSLEPARREAIRDFWQEYFRRSGAASVTWATDGPGRLQATLYGE